MRSRLRLVLIAASLLLAPITTRAAEQVVEAARAALPESVRASGVLKVATSLQWPPYAFTSDAGTADGIDIRLVRLLAEKLGLRAQIEDVKFPAIVPGVSSGRYDVGLNQINITAERAKIVDFVPYSQDGMGLLIRRGTPALDVNDLCGHTLDLTQGSAQVGVAERLSADCEKAGKKAITFQMYPNSADTYLALANGRGDGFMIGRASGVYIAQKNDKLEMTKPILANFNTISGIVIAKGNKPMQDAIRLALEAALQDGSYQRILNEFGVPDGALTLEQIRNPPPV